MSKSLSSAEKTFRRLDRAMARKKEFTITFCSLTSLLLLMLLGEGVLPDAYGILKIFWLSGFLIMSYRIVRGYGPEKFLERSIFFSIILPLRLVEKFSLSLNKRIQTWYDHRRIVIWYRRQGPIKKHILDLLTWIAAATLLYPIFTSKNEELNEIKFYSFLLVGLIFIFWLIGLFMLVIPHILRYLDRTIRIRINVMR